MVQTVLRRERENLLLKSKISQKPWYHGKDISGQDIRLLNRLMTGHNYSKFWLAKMKIVDNPECEWCEEDETAEHSIIFCSRYELERMQYSFDCAYANLIEVTRTLNYTKR